MGYPGIQVELTGLRIERLCRVKGITVRDIQQYLGLSCPQSIYRWFKGTTLPSLDHLYALAELLEVEVDDLLIGERKGGKNSSRQKEHRLLSYAFLCILRYDRICPQSA